MSRLSEFASPLSIAAQPGQPTLSAQQKKFNGLIRRIESQRKLLADWEEAIPLYQQRRASELEPLLDVYRALNIELAHFLDQASCRQGLGKTDRQTLREFIRDLAASLMDGEAHAAMKALYNKHSDSDFDTEAQAARDAMKSMVQDSFGLDLDLGEDVDMRSPEDLLRRLQQKMEAEQAQAAEQREHQRSKRKKTARQIRQEQEQQQVGRSVREVYRKLASALHPDREPDPRERERKTALMQRVNQAYAKNNLLDLLQLQLEIEQIDPRSVLALGEERLRHYNKVLAEQLSELEQETFATEQAFKMQFGLHPSDRLTPAKLMGQLRTQTQLLQQDIHQLKRQRRGLDDITELKRWLKEQRQAGNVYDTLPDELLDLFR